MKYITLTCLLICVVSVLSTELEEKDTCGVELVRCIEKKLDSDELERHWIECSQQTTSSSASTIEEVAEFVCNNKDDPDHVVEVEKARECVRINYGPGLYDNAKAECHKEMQDQ